MFNFFRLASRARVTWADKGPPTDNRGPPGATSGPLFPSHMTLQYSNWVGPILSSGFRVAAKLAFSDWLQAPWGPKKGQKGPFGALDVKIRMYGCEATEIAVVLAPTYLW